MQFDAVCAAAWSGYRYFHEWQELAPEDQAYLVAAYQLRKDIQALMQHESIEQSKKDAKKAKHGR